MYDRGGAPHARTRGSQDLSAGQGQWPGATAGRLGAHTECCGGTDALRLSSVLTGTVLSGTLVCVPRLNPFDFGGAVTGDYFTGRTSELAAVTSRLRNHIGVVVTAPRRYGKSSLVEQACLDLAKTSPKPAIVSVNLLEAGSIATVAGVLLRRLYQVPGGPWQRVRQALPGFLRRVHVQPGIKIDWAGLPTFTFAPGLSPEEAEQVLTDVYIVLDEIGEKCPSVLFLDEFQAVLDISPHLPRLLKALADRHRNVSLVLAGSRQHLMESLVLSKAAPLYNMLDPIALAPIPKEDWAGFLLLRARGAGKPFAGEDVVELLWRASQPVPLDVQRLAFASFEQADQKIDREVVERALARLVRHGAPGYARDLEALSAGQRRVLLLLARGTTPTVGSQEFASMAGLANATSVRKALQALEESELVVRREGRPKVNDPFFTAWLQAVEH